MKKIGLNRLKINENWRKPVALEENLVKSVKNG